MSKQIILSEMSDIMARVRWQESRDGMVCTETRFNALRAMLGLANKLKDNALKAAILKAYNWQGKQNYSNVDWSE